MHGTRSVQNTLRRELWDDFLDDIRDDILESRNKDIIDNLTYQCNHVVVTHYNEELRHERSDLEADGKKAFMAHSLPLKVSINATVSSG